MIAPRRGVEAHHGALAETDQRQILRPKPGAAQLFIDERVQYIRCGLYRLDRFGLDADAAGNHW